MSRYRWIYRNALWVHRQNLVLRTITGILILAHYSVVSFLFTSLMFKRSSQCLSAVANPQSQAEFLNKEPHKRHPGVTHLKTLRLPDELLMAARSIIESEFKKHFCYHDDIFGQETIVSILTTNAVLEPIMEP